MAPGTPQSILDSPRPGSFQNSHLGTPRSDRSVLEIVRPIRAEIQPDNAGSQSSQSTESSGPGPEQDAEPESPTSAGGALHTSTIRAAYVEQVIDTSSRPGYITSGERAVSARAPSSRYSDQAGVIGIGVDQAGSAETEAHTQQFNFTVTTHESRVQEHDDRNAQVPDRENVANVSGTLDAHISDIESGGGSTGDAGKLRSWRRKLNVMVWILILLTLGICGLIGVVVWLAVRLDQLLQ